MNCTRFEKLLPLYIEGDLATNSSLERMAREHLDGCDACRRALEEFSASQHLVHNYAAPDFGDEFYDGIRASVIREINRNAGEQRASLLQTLRMAFLHRPALAASVAIFVVIGAISFALYRSQTRESAPLVAVEGEFSEVNPNSFIEDASPQKSNDLTVSKPDGIGARRTPYTASRKEARRSVQPSVQEGSVLPETQDTTAANTASSASPNTSRNDGVSAEAPPVIARMEIQTSDPNIRIIWLGRKTSE